MRKTILLMLFQVMAVLGLNAQASFTCTVIDRETLEPIQGALVRLPGTHKVVAVSDVNGRFYLKETQAKILKITYLGYDSLTFRPQDGAVYKMKPATKTIGEVVVTAEETNGLTSTSRIGRKAMEHLQPSSFADLLELLPGGRAKDPALTTPNKIRLREPNPNSSPQYDTSSLGTHFLIDGAPISTNANMQYLGGALDSKTTARKFMNAGVDLRTISTDDIDHVEIVRGIPSVEYGDLTSGLVKISRKQGGHDWSARLKADMSSKLFYIGKGMEWERQSLNLSLDYLDAKDDPRNRLENYKRITASARYNCRWASPSYAASLSLQGDYGGSFDNDKEDPDVNFHTEDKYSSTFNRYALAATFHLESKKKTLFRSLYAMASGSYEHDVLSRTRVIQLQRDTPQPLIQKEGESDAIFLPFRYMGWQKADGKPLNIFLKAFATFSAPSNILYNSLKIGTDWSFDKNYGQGQVYDVTRPLNPGSTVRPRKLSDIPATDQLAFYAEENLKIPLGGSKIELLLGIRGTQLLRLKNQGAMSHRTYWDPRGNIGWRLPSFLIAGKESFVKLTAGIGWHTKFPTVEQMYPDLIYQDLVQMYYYHNRPELRRMNLMTYVIDPANPNLKPARNLKWEVGLDVNIRGNRLNLTYFKENMTTGFRSETNYHPYIYKKYDVSGIKPQELTGPPSLEGLPYEILTELLGYSRYGNGSQTRKTGLEFTLSTVRVRQFYTRLTITGAWFRTVYRNSQAEMVKPSVIIDNKAIQRVGIYHDNDGNQYETANTNFTFDTDIPRFKLGFSLSAQFLWYNLRQRLPLSNVPSEYMNEKGEILPYTEADKEDVLLRWLIRNYTESLYEKYRVPMSMNLNLKVTKKLIKDRLNIALYCNRILDYTPDYRIGEALVRRQVSPYFGMEINVNL